MQNRKDRKYKFNGVHLPDRFLMWLKGYIKRREATKDAMEFYNETLQQYVLFPFKSTPVKERPGYVTHNLDYFTISTEDQIVEQDLNNYFLNKYYMSVNDRIAYTSTGDELGDLFNYSYYGLVTDGICTYAVEWDEIEIDGRKYHLPTDFSWINSATLKFDQREGLQAHQKYSWVTKNADDYYTYTENHFDKGDLLVLRHPLYPSSPLNKALKLVDLVKSFYVFGLRQGKAINEPSNHDLRLEKTRYQPSEDAARSQALARVKARRYFKLPIGGFELSLTPYYEVVAHSEYLKQLNLLRDTVVNSFSTQILEEVRKRNNIDSAISLGYEGFKKNQKIDEIVELFKQRKIDVDEYSESVVSSYE